MNFAARIAEAAARFPDQVAIERLGTEGARATSYGALMADAGRWTAQLAHAGVSRGERVAILGENDEPWIAAYLGALRLGAVAVPLDTAYRAGQIRTILEHCGAAVLCASPRFLEAARGAGLSPGTPGTPGAPGTTCRLLVLEPEVAVDSPPLAPADMADMSAQDAAVILYTSGTTADPKGVVLTHGNLDAERAAALAVVDCHERDVILGVLPLFHALAQMANLLVPLSVGARVVFLETVSSASLVEALQTRGITIFVCVPQFFYLIHQRVMNEAGRAGAVRRVIFRVLLRANDWLREHGGANPGRRWFARVHRGLGPSMRLLVTGGSSFDPKIGRDLYALGFSLLNGYGLTETSGAATVQRPGDRFTTSIGQPLPGVEIRIDRSPEAEAEGFENEEARRPGRSGTGEILIRGPIVMREYFGRPDATAEALREGWLHTGDLGYLDAEHRLYITGRQKEIIVLCSGKNIYPEEVEAQYRQSPFIKEICVIGRSLPGAPLAERLHAIVVPDEEALRARGAVNVRELIRFELEGLSVQLPPHKRVLGFDLRMTPLPRTTTGKLRRHEIEQLARSSAADRSTASARALSDDEREWLSAPGRGSTLGAIAKAIGREGVAPDANLEIDLELDSMERVELLTTLERRAGVKVPAEMQARIFTVRQLVEAIELSASEPRNPGTSEPRNRAAPEPSAWEVLLAEPSDIEASSLRPGGWTRAILLLVVFRVVRILAWGVFRFRPTGASHVPARGPCIIAPNHQSHLDGLFVAAALPFHALRRLFFVGAAEYYQSRASRWLARLANIVPVDPDANLVAAMQVSAAGLRAGRVLVLFPEGERSIDGNVKTFRKGAAILSAYLKAPAVPVALDGPYTLWARGRPFNWRALLPWQAPRVRLIFGPPMQPAQGADAPATAELQRTVEHLLEKLRATDRTAG